MTGPNISARDISIVPINDLKQHPENPRVNDLSLIRTSIRAYGFVDPCLVQRSTKHIIAGNHRWQAAKDEGYDAVPVIFLDLTDEEALGLLLMHNKAGDDAGYDAEQLLAAWSQLAESEYDMATTGWDEAEVQALIEQQIEDGESSFRDGLPSDGDSDSDTDDPRGVALALQQATIGEPTHRPHRGQHYRLGGQHDLYIGEVVTDHQHWGPLLMPDDLFVPYPGPYIPLTTKGAAKRLVMVQPNVYLAGHLLDKWAAAHGEDSIVAVTLHG